MGDIAETLGLRQPQVSKHLRVLGESGLVVAQPLARRRIYRLEPESFAAISHWVDSFEQLWVSRLDALGSLMETTNTTTERTSSDE